MILSFAYTSPSLLARSKSVTRRQWTGNYHTHFWRGQTVQAWDKSPRFHGRHVADIQLLFEPTLEPISTMPDSDYALEGFAWLGNHSSTVNTKKFGHFAWRDFETWRHSGGDYWVVRFEILAIHETLEAWLTRNGKALA